MTSLSVRDTLPARNLGVDGFDVQPGALPTAERAGWQQIAPTTIVHQAGNPRFASDDWPFLYLHDKLIPDLNIRSIVILGVLGVAMVYIFLPKGRGIRFDRRMFFLGAAFMLLETKAVVQLALLSGSAWIVNSLVFFTAQILILLANLFVLKAPPTRLVWHYAGLIALLTIAIVTPFDMFLSGGIFTRYVVPCTLALGPMFFAGVIVARSFRDSGDPDMAFASNIAGGGRRAQRNLFDATWLPLPASASCRLLPALGNDDRGAEARCCLTGLGLPLMSVGV